MLKEHPEWLISVKIFTDIKHAQKGKKGFQKGSSNMSHDIGCRTIAKWLNKNGEFIDKNTG